MARTIAICALLLTLLPGCAQKPPAPKTYTAQSATSAAINVDGRLNEPEWRQAYAEGDFAFPWEERMAPLTQFRALITGEALCFSFLVDDASLVIEPFVDESTLDKEDRVEIFFAKDESLTPYYCIEIDPLGRVHDYEGRFHRQFDGKWNCAGLVVAGATNETGYVVEGKLPLATLHALDLPSLQDGKSIRMGLYRAEFTRRPDGTMDEGWISWVDPKVEEPDFHIPASFGVLR